MRTILLPDRLSRRPPHLNRLWQPQTGRPRLPRPPCQKMKALPARIPQAIPIIMVGRMPIYARSIL